MAESNHEEDGGCLAMGCGCGCLATIVVCCLVGLLAILVWTLRLLGVGHPFGL